MKTKKHIFKYDLLNRLFAIPLSAVLVTSPLQAGAPSTPEAENAPSASPLSEWWNGKNATGNWFGLRDTLEDNGLKFGAEWKANFLGIVSGGLQQRAGFDEEFKFRGTLDFAKLTKWEALDGLTLYSDIRWRDGDGVNKYAGTSSTFAPSTFQGGKQWRFQNVYLTYTTPELFGAKDFLTLSGGWQNPSDIFIKQPESKFFANNTFTSARGISANGIPWGGSYAAWGGYIKLQPTSWYYAQSGLYLAIPEGTNTRNHGLAFAGNRINPNLNGLYWITETGFTPKLGSSKLPGRYAAGLIYWGVENTSFYGENYDQKVLLYWQADQMLFREKTESLPLLADKDSANYDGKQAVPTEKPKLKLNDQGLYFFSLVNFAPKFNNNLPFYFQTGLIYKGLIPYRDQDQLGVAFAYGNYSSYKQEVDESRGRPVQTYEAVLEADYRIQVNKWAYLQPLAQYLIRPNGNGLTQNAFVLGAQFGVTF